MQIPRVRVLLGHPEDTHADLIIRPGWHTVDHGRVVTLKAPRWHPPNGPERALAEVYRQAVVVANERNARVVALPPLLVRGAWPLDETTRIALNVLHSTPMTAREVLIVASTPAMVERWAEALVREVHPGGTRPPR